MRVLLTGAHGMLGSSLLTAWISARPSDTVVPVGRDRVDLRDRSATAALLAEERPDAIIHAAATVGGIAAKLANPTRYLLDNLLLDSSLVGAAIDARVPELLYIGSAAVYPEHYRQPFIETDLLAAPLEVANEGYAIAKIAGTKLCEYASAEFGLDYRVAVPSNLYGPGDDFSESHGHLISAVLGKLHTATLDRAPLVEIWGDGTARREFTYAPDLADWLVSQIGRLGSWPPMINIGVGVDLSIAEYYEAARLVTGYSGDFSFDTSRPAGVHQRILDSTAARALGWAPSTSLEDGMASAYASFVDTHERRVRA
ncbi:MAG: hypothetical protein RI885_2660 [Actinomycetota bacterium]